MVQRAPSSRRRVVLVEEPDISEYLLQDILELAQPDRTHLIEQWIEAGNYDVKHGGTVKIVTNDKKPLQFNYEGQVFHIPPAGKRVTREVALKLLILYGRNGRYYGRDQRTGLEKGQEFHLTEYQERWASKQTFKFITQYLLQAPEKEEPEINARPDWETAVVDVLPDEDEEE